MSGAPIIALPTVGMTTAEKRDQAERDLAHYRQLRRNAVRQHRDLINRLDDEIQRLDTLHGNLIDAAEIEKWGMPT